MSSSATSDKKVGVWNQAGIVTIGDLLRLSNAEHPVIELLGMASGQGAAE